ncbi:unnamed protein product, partial [Ectocarpus sp. 8 AP-2014]
LAKSGLKPNSITYVSAIRAYGDKGDWERAEQVWGVQLTLVMHVRVQLLCHSNRCPGYVEGPKFSAAILVGMQKEHGVEPNRFCYSAVVKALANGGQWKRALETLDEMRECGLSADPV